MCANEGVGFFAMESTERVSISRYQTDCIDSPASILIGKGEVMRRTIYCDFFVIIK